MKKLCTLLIVLSSVGASAANRDLSHFFQRFSVTTNAAGDKIIVDNSLDDGNGVDLYVENLASYLMPNAAEFTGIYADATCKGQQYEAANQDLSDVVQKAIDLMQKTHIGNLLTQPQFLKFLKEMEALGDKFTKDKDYKVMANLNNPTYFYDKAIFRYFENKLISLAKSYIDTNAYMKVVNFIVSDYANHLARKKMYHQNYLMYYLETTPADQLGMTEDERGKALSSIDDSRLSFSIDGFLDSKKITKGFSTYGEQQLANTDKSSEKRWTTYAKIFDARISHINSFFSEASFEGSPLYINLAIAKDWIFDKKPSLAFDATCPNFLTENRRRYELARVALSVLPIPYSGKLDKILNVHYGAQAESEGMLFAHMEATDDANQSYILKQSVNPLLQ